MNYGINITDPVFGGIQNGSWSPAFQAAINSLEINGSYNGGIIFVPRGIYVLKTKIVIHGSENSENLSSITIEGEGMHSTILRFENSESNPQEDGLNIEYGSFVKLRNFSIRDSKKNNILFKSQNSNVPNHIEITNVRSSFASLSGIVFERSFLITMRDVFCSHNAKNGFDFKGYHTSTNAIGCYADNNIEDGWVINDMSYSSFISCASDNNRNGWRISNIRSVKLISCGGEFNSRSAFYVYAPEPSTTVFNDVISLSLESCFGYDNDKGNPGAYSNFLYIKTTSAGRATVDVKNCFDSIPQSNQNSVSVIIDGSGSRLIDNNNIFNSNVVGANNGIKTLVQYGKEIGPITVNNSNTVIIQLRDIFDKINTFGGLITVEARNSPLSFSNSNSATYVLLASKTVVNESITLISQAGLIQGNNSNWPSFTFSINSNGQLTASPIGSTSGNFYFNLSANGNISLK